MEKAHLSYMVDRIRQGVKVNWWPHAFLAETLLNLAPLGQKTINKKNLNEPVIFELCA